MEKKRKDGPERPAPKNKRKRLITGAVLLLVSLVLAWGMEGLQLASMPKAYDYALPEGSAPDISFSRLLDMTRYEWDEGDQLWITGADPQMYFVTDGIEGLRSAFLLFWKPTETDMQIQLFYAAEPGDFSEATSLKAICPAGTTFYYLPVPAGNYYHIRMDMDYEGPLPLQAIQFSSREPQKIRRAEGPHLRRVLIMTALWMAALCFMAWCHTWERIRKTLRGAKEGLKAGRKTALWYILLFPAAAGACIGLGALLMPAMAGKSLTGPAAVLLGLAGVNIAAALTFRKTLRTQPEYHFLLLCLSIGFLFCYYIPHTGLNSWDEEYHYNQALIASYVDEQRITAQDDLPIYLNGSDVFDMTGGGLAEIHDRQDDLYRAGAMSTRYGHVVIPSIPESINGLGLYLGRVLGLRYYQILVLGRLAGLLAYALAGFFAIRKLKSGKMIAAVVMLIPTSLFLTGSYNYDIYVTGFTLLGLSYYIAQWQTRDRKLTLVDTVIMVGAIVFGCIPKMVYFPLLWMLAFLPRDKFRSAKEHWLYLGLLAGATAFLILSYIGPQILRSGSAIGGEDSRGGDNVSASGQISFILSNPGEYLEILWKHLRDQWLNPRNASALLTNVAYYGITTHEHLFLILMMVTAFTDKSEADRGLVHRPLAHAAGLGLSFVAMIAALSSMYIMFTPVGQATINGAQYRYMIPVIYPFLAHLGSGLVDNRMDRAWYNGLVLGLAGFVGFACVFNAFVVRYF